MALLKNWDSGMLCFAHLGAVSSYSLTGYKFIAFFFLTTYLWAAIEEKGLDQQE